jgi:hypothetical protein
VIYGPLALVAAAILNQMKRLKVLAALIVVVSTTPSTLVAETAARPRAPIICACRSQPLTATVADRYPTDTSEIIKRIKAGTPPSFKAEIYAE